MLFRSFVESTVRPGGTHLTITPLPGTPERDRLYREGAEGLAQRLLSLGGWQDEMGTTSAESTGGKGQAWAADMLVSCAVLAGGRQRAFHSAAFERLATYICTSYMCLGMHIYPLCTCSIALHVENRPRILLLHAGLHGTSRTILRMYTD